MHTLAAALVAHALSPARPKMRQGCCRVAGRALPTSEGSVTTHREISPLQDKASTVVVRGGHSGTSEGAGVRGLEAGRSEGCRSRQELIWNFRTRNYNLQRFRCVSSSRFFDKIHVEWAKIKARGSFSLIHYSQSYLLDSVFCA